MKKLLLVAALAALVVPALSLGQIAQAGAWCPKPNGNDVTKRLPTGSVALLDESGLVLVDSHSKNRCQTLSVGEFECPMGRLTVVFTPDGSKFGEINMSQFDLSRPDIDQFEMWLLPENTVYSELMFVPCPGGFEPATM